MIEDKSLIAYLDGELDEPARRSVEAAVSADASLAGLLERHRRLRETVSGAFADVLDEPVPVRLLAAATRAAPQRRYSPPRWAALAATLALGVVGGGLLARYTGVAETPALVASGADGTLVAHGDLAKALSHQTAAASDAAAIRVGLSFHTADGRYCRTFAAPALHLAGLGCREADRWAAPVAVAYKPQQAEFRMASSETPPAVLAAVDEMIDGAPLDQAQEAAAIARNWRD